MEVYGIMAKASDVILRAANEVMISDGFASLSTREVARAAGVPLSQIHYHFGSKQNLIISVFRMRNDELLERQQRVFEDPSLSIADRWQKACEHLDDDLASGYVRTLMELWAAGWSDPDIAEVVRTAVAGWQKLIGGLVREAEKTYGTLGPFTPEGLVALISCVFIGAEAFLLLDFDEDRVPVRKSLGEFGALLRMLEDSKLPVS